MIQESKVILKGHIKIELLAFSPGIHIFFKNNGFEKALLQLNLNIKVIYNLNLTSSQKRCFMAKKGTDLFIFRLKSRQTRSGVKE